MFCPTCSAAGLQLAGRALAIPPVHSEAGAEFFQRPNWALAENPSFQADILRSKQRTCACCSHSTVIPRKVLLSLDSVLATTAPVGVDLGTKSTLDSARRLTKTGN